MAYTRKRLLKKQIDIQDITLEYTRKGVSQEWVFHNIISPKFYIGRSTYYEYLAKHGLRAELKQIEQIENLQTKLF
ncbi:MAG: hypothetical protein N4A72_22070 [Bacteroidales bacterium]|jgi:hypothetical protein|nr:hypothetical protein [Bacteroidales bacterium]